MRVNNGFAGRERPVLRPLIKLNGDCRCLSDPHLLSELHRLHRYSSRLPYDHPPRKKQMGQSAWTLRTTFRRSGTRYAWVTPSASPVLDSIRGIPFWDSAYVRCCGTIACSASRAQVRISRLARNQADPTQFLTESSVGLRQKL